MVTVGCDLADSARAVDVAQRFELSATIGIHPHEAKDAPHDVGAAFDPLLARGGVVAIGETGLDYYYDHSPRDAQRHVLIAQIGIARERRLPLVFHQRDAHDDFVEVLRAHFHPGHMRGVVHCFTGSTEQARVFTGEFGLLLGIGGVITFPNAAPLREAVAAVGVEHVVLETDCPYLSPVPVRGRRNEPAFMLHTAAKVAGVLGIERSEVARVTDRNARTLFAL
jgi:TatD DNase family protein